MILHLDQFKSGTRYNQIYLYVETFHETSLLSFKVEMMKIPRLLWLIFGISSLVLFFIPWRYFTLFILMCIGYF